MDYYSVLGISKTASYDEIKQAYRTLVIKYHPDKNPNINTAQKFNIINEAYNILSNPYTRGKYDAKLEGSFRFPSFGLGFPKSFQNGTYSSSYTSVSHMNQNGVVTTKKNIEINNNGKKDNYYKEYYIDKHGQKHLIKETGNKNLKQGQTKKTYKLITN